MVIQAVVPCFPLFIPVRIITLSIITIEFYIPIQVTWYNLQHTFKTNSSPIQTVKGRPLLLSPSDTGVLLKVILGMVVTLEIEKQQSVGIHIILILSQLVFSLFP